MSNKPIDITPESKQGDNIFDTYHIFIEKQKLQKELRENYETLNKSIDIIERNLIDLSEKPKKLKSFVDLINKSTITVLEAWFPIMENFNENLTFIDALSYNLLGLSLISKDLEISLKESIYWIIGFFSPSIDYDEFLNNNKKSRSKRFVETGIVKSKDTGLSYSQIHLEFRFPEQMNYKIIHRQEYMAFGFKLEDASERTIEEFRDKVKSKSLIDLIYNYQLSMYDTAEAAWKLKIKTTDNHPSAIPLLSLLQNILIAINLASEDVDITLDDWGNGSKWAIFNIKFKSPIGKEDVKSVIDKGFKSVDAQYFQKPVADINKTEAETEKIKKETDLLVNADTAKESHELDLEMKRMAVFEKALELEERMLNLRNKQLDQIIKLSEMISKGIIENDSNIQIEINGLLVHTTEIKIDPIDINLIESRESVQPKLNLPKGSSE